jgi:hypothetical protein
MSLLPDDDQAQPRSSVQCSSVELRPLNINPILPDRHPQILHCQDRPALPTPSLTTTSESRPLDA